MYELVKLLHCTPETIVTLHTSYTQINKNQEQQSHKIVIIDIVGLILRKNKVVSSSRNVSIWCDKELGDTEVS